MKIIIVGAGASGLVSAYKLREKGHDVTLLEKSEKVGKKICITGKGRCNLTNDCSTEEFIKNVVNNDKFLYSAINNFTCQDTMSFFESLGVPLVVERGHRVFPSSMKAKDIPDALLKANKQIGVDIHLNEEVKKVSKNIDDTFLVLTNKNSYVADKVVIATGGLSYSYTGSTGDGYKFAKNFSHTIIDTVPALSALKIKERIPEKLFKFTQKNVTLEIKTSKKTFKEFGELTFYKEGLAGPICLTLSSLINRIDPNEIELSIDFKPALNEEKLEQRLLREIKDNPQIDVKELLRKLLPYEILDWFISISKIKTDTIVNFLKKEERDNIISNLKHFKLTYQGLDNIERATVTSGGVSTKEINPRTMESKLCSGLYFIGEVIDVDAFTGGFNLQIAFSTASLLADNLD